MEHEIQNHRMAATLITQLKALLRTMRPKQWLPKNGIVFASLVLSEAGLALNLNAILRAIAAFIIFILISSTAYILNDLMDIEKDRAHPTKRNRPYHPVNFPSQPPVLHWRAY